MKFRALLIFCALSLIVCTAKTALPVNGEVKLYDKVVRLHVIANSDTEKDQELKMKVRDRMLSETSELLNSAKNSFEAQDIISQNKEELEKKCKECLQSNGCDMPVEIVLGVENYPEREYDGVALPAGDYYSVRVMIGEAKGHNFWCVLFPQLCVGASTEHKTLLASAGLTKSEVGILTENDSKEFVLKFRIVEFFRKTFARK